MSDGRYVVTLQGDCMGAGLVDGMQLVVDPTETIKSLDFVSITLRAGTWNTYMRDCWWKAGGASAEYPEGMVKLFLKRGFIDGNDVILFGHMHPPCVGIFRADEIESMHRVVGALGGEIDPTPGDQEQEAYLFLSALRGRGTYQPINPQWRSAPLKEAA